MEQTVETQTVNLTIYGYKGKFINTPVISIYYNGVFLGDVTQNEIKVFEVTVPGNLLFKFKSLSAVLPISGANGVQVDFDRINGGLLLQQWLPIQPKENEVHNRKPPKEKFSFKKFWKNHKWKVILCAAALAVLIAMFLVADAINNTILTNKVQAYLDGKTFIEGEYGWDESADVYRFEDGKVYYDCWRYNEFFTKMEDTGWPYKVKGELFGDYLSIYANDGSWYSMLGIKLNHDGTVEPAYEEWRQITMEELEAMRLPMICQHSFRENVLSKASCSQEGRVLKTCTICGYEETQTSSSLGHVYKDNVCTRCGEQKPPEKSDIRANTWYTYGGVLAFKNCEVISAGPMGNGMAVHYYSVCSSCHVAAEMSALAGPEPNYPISKIYTCRHCSKWTTVEMKLGNFGN